MNTIGPEICFPVRATSVTAMSAPFSPAGHRPTLTISPTTCASPRRDDQIQVGEHYRDTLENRIWFRRGRRAMRTGQAHHADRSVFVGPDLPHSRLPRTCPRVYQLATTLPRKGPTRTLPTKIRSTLRTYGSRVKGEIFGEALLPIRTFTEIAPGSPDGIESTP